MHIEYYDKYTSIPLSRERWKTLVSENETNTIFQTQEWAESWLESAGSHYNLFFIAVFEGSDIIGFAPLVLNKTKLGIKKELMFIGDQNADYLDFILPIKKQECLSKIIDFLYSKEKTWNRLSLRNIPDKSSTVKMLADISRDNHMYLFTSSVTGCPALELDRQREDTKRILNKYSIKRPLNYFNRIGKLEFRIIQDEKELHNNLPTFFEQHIKRWQKTTTKSLFVDEKNRHFYSQLADKLLLSGNLFFTVLLLDGIPISFHYGFIYDKKMLWYKPSFEISLSRHSPGLLMIRYLLEYAIDNGLNEFDFTIGDEDFKKRFSNARHTNYSIIVYKSLTLYLYSALRKAIFKFAKSIAATIHKKRSDRA